MFNRLHGSRVSYKFLGFTESNKFYLKKSFHGFTAHFTSQDSHRFNTDTPVTESFPTDARIVVGGGGIIGCSVAYHLAKAGWKNIVLLDQGRLCGGSTWQSSGVVGCLRTTPSEVAIVSESIKLYKHLHASGYDIGLQQAGSLNLCRKQDRVIYYKRSLLIGQRFGVEGEFLSPTEIKTRVPLLRTEDLLGGVWVPGDLLVDPNKVTAALANEAVKNGVRIIENCKINQVLSSADLVCAVETSLGRINCDNFVNCAGMWAHDLGLHSNTPIRVPLHPCEQPIVQSKPFAGISADMPVIRDYDGRIYFHECEGGILGSGFPLIGKPAFKNGIPSNFEFQALPEDWDYFKPLLDQLIHRIPNLVHVEPKLLSTGVESSTPDGKYIMGGVPEIQNYYVAAGMNSTGVAAAGGVGKYLTEWIINGESSLNLWSFDVQRFVELHNNVKFLRDRVSETFGTISHVPYWESEMIGYDSGRRLRTSALFTRNEPYAVFGQTMAYERPLYFHSASTVDDDADNTWTMPKSASIHGIKAYELHQTGLPKKGTYGKPEWLENVRSEYWACREGVCIIDMSTFAKFELMSAGREVVDFLQYICSNDIDRTVGSVIHTGMQNNNGGFENDCSVIRLAYNRYFMVGPTAQQTRCFAWLKDHLPKDGSVVLNDVTSMYTSLDVIGPKAQELLSELTDTPLNKQDFMHMTCKDIDVGMVSGIRAMRLTHTGEDGFMLYVPSEVALHVYDSLVSYGKNYGLKSAGYYALRALRTEKFFAYWGTDLTPQDTPLESGRDFRVKYDLGGFIGYSALIRQRAEGIRKRLVLFVIEDHNIDEDPWPWSGEPIYRNGIFCGFTTSTAYGFGLERNICLGFVQDFDQNTGVPRLINPNQFILDKSVRFEINIAGKLFPARASLYPPVLQSPLKFQ